ncbi:GntR family transcriptional regulator [Cupriavidus sp. 8B]
MGDSDQDTIPLPVQAHERLQEMLVTLVLPPGEMISEGKLAEYLEIGRTPVREAIQRLAYEGLLKIMPARGIMVTPINVVHQLQILEIRRQLEPHIARKAARIATDAQRVTMRQLASSITRSAARDTVADFMRANREVHSIKVAAASNEVLDRVMDNFYGLSMRFWYANYRHRTNSLIEAAELHASILTAITSSDEEEAGAQTHKLLDFLEAFTLATLES